MANKKISELTEILSVVGTDVIPIVDGGITKKVSVDTIASYVLGGASPGDLGVLSLSSNWESTYSTVQTNSAVNWNYQGTDLKSLSANWQNTFTNFSAQSANNNSVYSSVASNSATWNAAAATAGIDTGVRTLSSGWQNTYTNFSTQSANNVSVYSNVQSNSAYWASNIDTGVRALSSNWQTAYTNLIANSAAYLSSVDLSFLSVSANWNSTYSTVQTNSANWASHIDTGVRTLSSNWQNTYTAFSTQSANNASVYSNVQSNSALYATISYTDSKFFTVSGGVIGGDTRINGKLTVFGDLSCSGTQTFANTVFATTSALSVVNIGAGPALYVGNNGSGDVASFYDIDQNVEILHIGGVNSSFPNVGVKTSSPNKDFTVKGEISASSTIWDSNGNSNQWNSVYSSVASNSANWASHIDTGVRALSSNWQNTYTAFGSQSANNASVYSSVVSNSATWNFPIDTGVRSLSANWQNTYSTVQSNSANWASHIDNEVRALSSNWQNTYTAFSTQSANNDSVYSNVSNNSANWSSAYTNLVSNSAAYLSSVDLSFLSVSANWDSTYTTVQNNSADWSSHIDSEVRSLSSNWQNTYTAFSTQSANNDSVYSTVGSNSASWNYQGSDLKALSANWEEAYTNLVSNSAAYLSSVDISFLSVSANWDSTYTTVNSNSASWNSVYTYVNSNSSTFGTGGSINGSLYLPLSGGAMSGTLTVSGVSNLGEINATVVNATSGENFGNLNVGGNGNFQGNINTFGNIFALGGLSALNATFADSVSAPVMRGAFYGDGANLINIPESTALTTLSANWQNTYTDFSTQSANNTSVYSNVRSNSANWASHVDTGVRALSANWQNTYTAFSTQSANNASVYSSVASNSATYATISYTDSKFFTVSGGVIGGDTRINGKLTVFGDLSCSGTQTFANTVFSTTSALSVVNVGSGPALIVGQNGNGDVASFYDLDQNIEILHIGGQNSSFPNVGVKVSDPNKDFTVKGEISASSTIWDPVGNSNQWNSVYSSVKSTSGSWNTPIDAGMRALSSNWQNTYSTVNSLSGGWSASGLYLPLSGGTISDGLTANSGTFTSYLNAPALSGTHYGDGTNLIGTGPCFEVDGRITTLNGTLVGNTFTNSVTGALSALDSYAFATGDSLLWYFTGTNAGLWTVLSTGSPTTSAVLIRPSYYQGTLPWSLALVGFKKGTAQGTWLQLKPNTTGTYPVVVNSTSMTTTTVINPAGNASVSGNTYTNTQTLVAGSTTIAPLKFQAGSLQTAPAAHSLEWDGIFQYNTTFAGVRTQQAAFVPVPSTMTSPGSAGQIAYDNTSLYVCVSANGWRRAALTTF